VQLLLVDSRGAEPAAASFVPTGSISATVEPVLSSLVLVDVLEVSAL
jgi:hypothetical protein